ncbi:MBL fold metallo-hydrolase [Roseobacter sp. HKCCD9010]|uniref:MBL fold metallo-hydrolase n=1 Tax=unclassified Roseobacter TaxID=196798 RepID=UPI001491AC71|nr:MULTISPECIES: MBL fold metallo-hydrolase [unclassified Roseobacter]MBF9049764.1 MBL fold metallo-hydrolase [Rhodobacterales bacterium HKCCD4356]NNV13697.1 MBL fold metallo-hydrolase [Roseobacter sp. HKCCD7357]NNV16531.1 MBL fold metallo-hydrolase [Roseobacter sp. HKCCD8768]NNV25990.1 MBL fold metallo-hydrolase [Roseobacter sp. HKCCD8192]NNV30250.1 MBL fold metallo-hydrolase [Roseobacter sp. HKCCD9061]
MADLKLTILGCGSSGGVPRLGDVWGECDPNDPRNRRRRCSLLVQRITEEGETAVLIDTSPDLRQQLLDAGIGRLDAVLFTHAHADHTHGLDDLRMIVFNMRQRLPVYADGPTQNDLLGRFGYAFVQPAGSAYPPILDLHAIDGDVTIEGAGGPITFTPFEVTHGNIDALGFRMGDIAYLPDVSDIPDVVWPVLAGLDCWIVDALRRTPHPSHAHLDLTLEWIARAAPKRAVLTNMHIDLDYQTVADETPDHITPAYDGMVIRAEV